MSKLRRELGVRDVTLLAIICITGSRWIPAAAHAGPGSVTLWIAAAAFFAMPLAVAVGALTQKYSGCAGGLYVWTRNDFGQWHGFLCTWIYWIGIAFWMPTAALFYMGAGFFALGPKYAHLADNRAALLTVALAAIWVALGTNLRGVNVGKWTENAGATATWILGGLAVTLAVIIGLKRGSATTLDIVPKWNWGTVSFWSNIAYAMTGLELVGMMGEEIRDPERTIPKAGWLGSGFATAFYSIVTVAMLVLLRPDQISERSGWAQAGVAAGVALGVQWIGPLVAVLMMASALGQFGGLGTSVSRLPFAVAEDKLLPASFGRVHPRWGTPHVSIVVFGIVSSFLLVVFQVGDSLAAAYDELVSLMVITGFIPYVYLFGSAWKAGKRLSAISGWLMTVLAIVCSVVPTAEITKVWLFEGKLIAGTVVVIGSGWCVYGLMRRRVE